MKRVLFLISIAFFQESYSQTFSAGGFHCLAICNDGTIMAWGGNDVGQLGNGTNTDSNIPVLVNSLVGVTAVAAGVHHSLALRNDSTVWAWGYNFEGELGNGTNVNSNIPVQVPGLTGIIKIATGLTHSFALKNDGTVWVWGFMYNTSYFIPTQLSSLSGIVQITGGSIHSMALKSDGTVWTWGHNGYGQLGNGTFSPSTIPVQVNALTNINSISAGEFHCMALKNDGTVWTWGFSGDGELGNGSTVYSNVPVLVDSLTGIADIAAGYANSFALKNDGTVWAWGYNGFGELGNGTNGGQSSVPIQANILNANRITAGGGGAGGSGHILAIKNDGTLWSWGANFDGELGNGNFNNSNVPIHVSGACNPTDIKQTSQELTISIAPNPSTGVFLVNFKQEGLVKKLRIYNTCGEQFLEKDVNKCSLEVDLIDKPKGIYFLELVSNEGRVVKKIALH